MSTTVKDIQIKNAVPAFAPKSARSLGLTADGLYINDPAQGTVAVEHIAFISALSLQKGDKNPWALMLFIAGKPAPLMVAASRIAYGQFPGLDDKPGRANFRKCISWFCKHCPSLRIDRATYQFLKTGQLAPLPDTRLTAFATAVAAELGLAGAGAEAPRPAAGGAEDTLPARPAPFREAGPRRRHDTLPSQKIDVAPPTAPGRATAPPAPAANAFDELFPDLDATSTSGSFEAPPDTQTNDVLTLDDLPELPAPPSYVPTPPRPAATPRAAAPQASDPFSDAFPELRPTPPSAPAADLSAFPELEDLGGPRAQPSTPPPTAAVTCPKCGHRQPPTDECVQCGIVIAKYRKPAPPPPKTESPFAYDPGEEDGAAGGTLFDEAHPMDQGSATDGPITGDRDRFLSMDAALAMTLGLLRDNILSLSVIAIVFLLMGVGLFALLAFGLMQSLSAMGQMGGVLFMFPFMGIQLAVWTLVTLGVSYHLNQVVDTGACSVGDSLTQAFMRFPRAFFGRLIAAFLTVVGTFAGIVPGGIYFTRFYFTEIVCAVEPPENQHIGATQISRNLVQGYEFSVFGFICTFSILYTLALYLPFYLLLLIKGPLIFNGLMESGSLGLLVGIYWLALTAGSLIIIPTFSYVLYLEVRTINRDKLHYTSLGIEPMTRNVFLFVGSLIVYWILLILY